MELKRQSLEGGTHLSSELVCPAGRGRTRGQLFTDLEEQ